MYIECSSTDKYQIIYQNIFVYKLYGKYSIDRYIIINIILCYNK